MTLSLDLSASRAKLDRASDLLQTLDRELRASIHERHPYTIIQDFDEESGWLSLKLKPELADLRFSVMVGELVHDLRSALDYIVTALIAASGVTLTKWHQYPLYTDEARFVRDVGTSTAPKGCLAGLKHGFFVIRDLQPFNLNSSPDRSSLAMLHRLSNSDKHRVIMAFQPFPEAHDLRIVIHEGRIVDQWQQPGPIEWQPDRAMEFQRIRFARPYPTKVEPQASLKLELTFVDSPFPPDYPQVAIVALKDFETMLRQVTEVIRAIEMI